MYGFIRKCGYYDLMITDLIKLIMQFYGLEWLHVVQYTGQHWKIPLNDIFLTADPNDHEIE